MISLSAFAVGLLALPSLISAVPATLPNTSVIDVPEFEIIRYYEQYAAASYCLNNVQGGNGPVTCPTANNCPDVQTNRASTTLKFQK
jgi:hypothetical protein